MQIRPFMFLLALCAALLPGAAHAERQWFAEGPIPLRYDISIVPDAQTGAFTAEARITIESSEPLPAIVMNQMDLTIASASINGARAAARADNEAQTLTLTPRPHRCARAGTPSASAIRAASMMKPMAFPGEL